MNIEESKPLIEPIGAYVIERTCSTRELTKAFWRRYLTGEPGESRIRESRHERAYYSNEIDQSACCYDILADRAGDDLQKPPPWRIGFTHQFRKEASQLDRKLQGRIFEAIQELSVIKYPLQVTGDTFKPLTGNLKGFWRYRLGDFRLVVKPVPEQSEIDLITFAARGGVYD